MPLPTPILDIRIHNGFLWLWACQRGEIEAWPKNNASHERSLPDALGKKAFPFAPVLSRLASDRQSDWKLKWPPLDLMIEIMEN